MHKTIFTKVTRVFVTTLLLIVNLVPLTNLSQQKVKADNGDINSYIRKNNFPNPKIQTRLTPFFNVGSGYRNGVGRPEGIVVHETGNSSDIYSPNAINNEINYEVNNWNVPGREAYVHAFVDRSQIINVANTDLTCWGAGPIANSRYISIELCEEGTMDNFARSVNNDAYYVAYLLKKYNLPVTNATHTGSGTVWSHHAVSNFLGGTNHSDPTGYFNSWGYSMDQFFQLVQMKYNNLSVNKAESVEKVAQKAPINETDQVSNKANNQSFYYLTDAGIISGGNANQFIGKNYQSTAIVKTKNNGIYTLITSNGRQIAWIRSGQLDLLRTDPVTYQRSVQNIAYLVDNSPLYYLLNNGFQAADISGPYSYSIRSIAQTSQGKIYYLLNDNWTGKPFMWVDSENVSLKNSLDSQLVSTIKGRPAVPDKKGSHLPAAVKVKNATATKWLLTSGLQPTGTSTKENTHLFVLGNKNINGVNYSNVSFDGFVTMGYVPSDTLVSINPDYVQVISNQTGVAIINQASGAQVYVYPGDGQTGQTLPKNSAWKYRTLVTASDGSQWYQVGSYQWLKASDVNIKY